MTKGVIIQNNPTSKAIIIAFGGINNEMGIPVFEFFNIMKNKNFTKVFVRDLRQSWYHRGVDESYNISDLCRKLKLIIESFQVKNNKKRVIFIGNSAGGYAALIFGVLLNVDKITALCDMDLSGGIGISP